MRARRFKPRNADIWLTKSLRITSHAKAPRITKLRIIRNLIDFANHSHILAGGEANA
jgi:hypothetical protein